MKPPLRFLGTGIAVAATLVACATNPPATPAPTIVSPQAKAQAQVQPGVDGYRRVVKDGQELFCREEGVLGSRVQRGEVCQTAAQIATNRRNTDAFLHNAQGAAGAGPGMSGPQSATTP